MHIKFVACEYHGFNIFLVINKLSKPQTISKIWRNEKAQIDCNEIVFLCKNVFRCGTSSHLRFFKKYTNIWNKIF